jgi:hypothetical protein
MHAQELPRTGGRNLTVLPEPAAGFMDGWPISDQHTTNRVPLSGGFIATCGSREAGTASQVTSIVTSKTLQIIGATDKVAPHHSGNPQLTGDLSKCVGKFLVLPWRAP